MTPSRPLPTTHQRSPHAGAAAHAASTRADEKTYLAEVKKWSLRGSEWFRVPDDPGVLHWLWLVAEEMGQWQGVKATHALARVIANNLRRAA
jgi:hypothetical protein